MNTKNWKDSKTILLNLLAFLFLALDLLLKILGYLEVNFELIKPLMEGYLSAEAIALISIALPPLNLYLRSLTSEAVSFGEKE